jgi:general L-amino acid transport system permease protein
MASPTPPDNSVPLWRDDRILRLGLQALVLVVVVGAGAIMVGNMNRNLQQLGRQFDYGFLKNQAGFNIGESILPYAPNDSYGWALFVGLVNTLRLILVGFITTTAVGILAGIASFSDNWLIRRLNLIYVEVVRNTPLLLQLFCWYFVILFGLSQGGEVRPILGGIYVSKKGLTLPWPANTPAAWLSALALVMLAVAAYLVWRWHLGQIQQSGRPGRAPGLLLWGLGAIALSLFCFGLGWSFPRLGDDNLVVGGVRISLEYAAMLAGLTFYTGAFIAEIVRAGIQSVSRGQWEAARSLGLKTGLALRLVVFPQALRVIIPSLSGQYMNLAKNSSLALAIGYPDIFATGQTIQNQTGRAVEVVLLWAVTYLSINLIISLVMNRFNQSVQIRER